MIQKRKFKVKQPVIFTRKGFSMEGIVVELSDGIAWDYIFLNKEIGIQTVNEDELKADSEFDKRYRQMWERDK